MDLTAILQHYDNKVLSYYDAGAIAKDSLTGMIKDLFINTALYECQPDLRTLDIKPDGDQCLIQVTIRERLRESNNTPVERFTSTVEYRINNAMKIISERKAE